MESSTGIDRPPGCSRVAYVAKKLEEKSAASWRSEVASGVPCITAVQDDNGAGILTKAAEKLRRGDCVLQCCAAGMAIESQFRTSRCADCAQPCQSGTLCSGCGIVGACERCKSSGADNWHSSSGECQALRAFVWAFSAVFGLIEEDDFARINATDLAKEIDSSYIITVQLLFRRWLVEKPGRSSGDIDESKGDSSILVLPAIDWKLFDSLHKSKVGGEQYDLAIAAICGRMRTLLRDMNYDGDNTSSNRFVITKDAFDDVLGRVVGCGHAVVDLTLGLGSQAIGRAIFLEHSFYNHSCCPNAFISCRIGNIGASSTSTAVDSPYSCALVASVHCLSDIERGDDVRLSYIPTSGLSRNERQQQLQAGHNFQCECRACSVGDETAKEWDRCLAVPEGSDLESLREVQYRINHTFVESSDRDEIERSLGLARMVSNGVKNQGISSSHECALEVHRLLSVGYAALDKFDDAIGEHHAFFASVGKISDLFDPIALATQHIEYALVLHKNGDSEGERSELEAAELLAKTALGEEHPYVTAIERKIWALRPAAAAAAADADADADADAADQIPAAKRPKMNDERSKSE